MRVLHNNCDSLHGRALSAAVSRFCALVLYATHVARDVSYTMKNVSYSSKTRLHKSRFNIFMIATYL